jgi:O-antigen ligase
VEDPKLVHNTYLQLLAETGVIGLGLFLALIGMCFVAALRAARAFQRAGSLALAALAQSVVIAQVGFLVSMFFLSIGTDLRLWLLLGLGPALAAIARAVGASRPGRVAR